MNIYILLSGIGIGCIVGFCIKIICFSSVYKVDQQEEDTQDYINYLEDMLDNSTEITTESHLLNHVEPNLQNISADMVTICPDEPEELSKV